MSSPGALSIQQVSNIVQGEVQSQTRGISTKYSTLESRVNQIGLSQSHMSKQVFEQLHSLSNKLDGKARVLEDGISEVNRNTQTLVQREFDKAADLTIETDISLYEHIKENKQKLEEVSSKVDSLTEKVGSMEGKIESFMEDQRSMNAEILQLLKAQRSN